MKNNDLSRREFAVLMGTAAAAALVPEISVAETPSSTITASEVIARIQKQVGVPWQTPTMDTFKAGDPATAVRGIATTFMATIDVLKKSAASNCNLVITHEPTYWNHPDETKDFADDPIYRDKLKFIRDNGLVVWRFHDHWHRRHPDGVLTGVVAALGWQQYQSTDPNTPRQFTIPEASLNDIAMKMQSRLGGRITRVVGDPKMCITRVAMSPGYAMLEGTMSALQRPDVELFVCGELREWEGVEYVKDAVALGHKKALIILGHTTSEEPGMQECATWLKTFVPEVPVKWIPAGEPYWMPA